MDKHKTQLEQLEADLSAAKQQEAREAAYVALLSKYPLLYGYWLKYLKEFYSHDKEKWLTALDQCPVLELYIAYFEAFTGTHEDYKLAINKVGHFFQAAPIWDKYLALDKDHETAILDQVIKVPLYDYAKYFALAQKVAPENATLLAQQGQEMAENINARWAYESKIKRPYFHVVALEQQELENWNNYLDFQELSQDILTTAAVYRRCLTATALYPQFWFRYLRWVYTSMPEMLEKAYSEAILYISNPELTELSILYASYLEVAGDDTKALHILTELGDQSALDDFNYRHGARSSQLTLEQARELWQQKQIKRDQYLEILKTNGALDEFFDLDIMANGPPDAVKALRKRKNE